MMAQNLLQKQGLKAIMTNCNELKGLTVGEAVSRSQLKGGGHVFALFGCVDEHYDSSIACSGTHEGTYTCYNNSKNKDYPFGRMLTYLEGVSNATVPTNGRLYELQALWQETTESVIIGELHGSSLMLDEAWSGLNQKLAIWVRSNRLPHISMLEVNNVCDGGNDLLAAIAERRRSINKFYRK